MRFREWDAEWDEDNIEHIARHGVRPEEVEEIVYEDCHPSWIVRGTDGAFASCGGPYSAKRAPADTCVLFWRSIRGRNSGAQ